MSDVNVMEQQPAGGNPMQPDSGTYGERAELNRLQQTLPRSSGPGSAPMLEAAAPPAPMPSAPPPAPAPSGLVPEALLRPTERPDVPVYSPLDPSQTGQFPGAVNAQQRRLMMLEMLSDHPDASPEMREWASIVRQKLIERE